jgi:RNA polymerase sigma-70 factor, ECF subfamily
MDDNFLIRQILGGHRNAFRLLVIRYQRPLFRYLGGFGLGRAVTEELAQEVFLRAFRALDSFDASKAAFSTWLFTIAKRLALNERSRSRERATHVEPEESQMAASQEAAGERLEDRPDDRLERSERRSRVRQALQTLPEALRSTLLLAYLKELSMDQIAQIENCALGTVKSRIFRGKALLRAALVDWEDLP